MLQSTGKTVYSMYSQGAGAITNIIMDPILIFGMFGLPEMGVAGAAYATVLGQIVSAIVGATLNQKKNKEITIQLKGFRPDFKMIKQIYGIGIPSIIMASIGSVMNFSMNQILQGFSETATGVFGIYFKLQSFFFMPLFGINNATISIMAYNYGARDPKRIMGTLKRVVITDVVIMLIGLAAFQFLPDLLLGMFNPSDEFLRIGRGALRTISLAFPLAAIGISVSASFQALGDGIYSTITSLCRQMLVLLPAAYLLSLTGEVTMVWWAYPIAECISVFVTLFLFSRIYKKKIKPLTV